MSGLSCAEPVVCAAVPVAVAVPVPGLLGSPSVACDDAWDVTTWILSALVVLRMGTRTSIQTQAVTTHTDRGQTAEGEDTHTQGWDGVAWLVGLVVGVVCT